MSRHPITWAWPASGLASVELVGDGADARREAIERRIQQWVPMGRSLLLERLFGVDDAAKRGARP